MLLPERQNRADHNSLWAVGGESGKPLVSENLFGVQEVEEERMLKWFVFGHLPEHLQAVSSKFYDVACSLCALVDSGPERTVALRKLLEAKDAAVRAKLNPGG